MLYYNVLQSDIIHQSVMELIHSEDREEFKRQLTWNSMLPADKANLTLHEVMMPGELQAIFLASVYSVFLFFLTSTANLFLSNKT